MRHLGMLVAIVTLTLAVVSPALADGLPVGNLNAGPEGVEAANGLTRYVALPLRKDTIVLRLRKNGGLVLRSRFLRGRFVVPVVALDGSAGGLSHDGSTLMLIRPRVRFPRSYTSFAVLHPTSLRVRQRVRLSGDFSFDALSPDGGSAYLVQYVSRTDPTRYVVRRYDVRAGRLVPGAVVDPRERTVIMRGFPVTRASSPDGSWAYTLYDGFGPQPFVHALDTVGGRAVCIDLARLPRGTDVYALRLAVSLDGNTLTVSEPAGPISLIDTRTFEVSPPIAVSPAPVAKPSASPPQVPTSPGVNWAAWIGGASAILLVAAALAFALRRRRRVVAGTA